VMPVRAATAAVGRVWFNSVTPAVISMSAPAVSASARMNPRVGNGGDDRVTAVDQLGMLFADRADEAPLRASLSPEWSCPSFVNGYGLGRAGGADLLS
jgi:hypothetical protein